MHFELHYLNQRQIPVRGDVATTAREDALEQMGVIVFLILPGD